MLMRRVRQASNGDRHRSHSESHRPHAYQDTVHILSGSAGPRLSVRKNSHSISGMVELYHQVAAQEALIERAPCHCAPSACSLAGGRPLSDGAGG